MATFTISKGDNSISINSFTDEQPGQYQFSVDTLNNILVVKAENGGYTTEIHTATDAITVNGEEFSGTASELKTLLLSDVFISSGSGGTTIGGTYDSNTDAVAALGTGKLYKSSTLVNGSPIILITI